jgi:hypothetical protein
MKTRIHRRLGVCLLVVPLLRVAVPLANAENPLTDRCSGHVFISSSYSDSDPHNIAREGLTIERDNSYWDHAPGLPDNWVGPWSSWIPITQTKDRYVRWYCFEALYQTTGLGVSCATFNSCDDNHNRPTGFNDVGTAERSRCDFEPKSVRVRIGKQRKFQIECSSESAASNGSALTKTTIRLYDGIWRPSDSAEIQWYGQTYDEYQKKYADLWKQNWRIYLLNTYVANGKVLYDAVWRPGNTAEIQWYGQTYDEYQKKYTDLWKQNWRIYLLNTYVANGKVLYDAVWRPGNTGEIQWYGQTYDEYQKQYAGLWQQNWRLQVLRTYEVAQ